jgi:hypothetical protein
MVYMAVKQVEIDRHLIELGLIRGYKSIMRGFGIGLLRTGPQGCDPIAG